MPEKIIRLSTRRDKLDAPSVECWTVLCRHELTMKEGTAVLARLTHAIGLIMGDVDQAAELVAGNLAKLRR